MSNFHVYDSSTHEEFPDQQMAAISYLTSWQMLRQRCFFSSIQHAQASVALLDAYVAHAIDKTERQYRIWRAGNLLRAVPRITPRPMGNRGVTYEVGHYMPDQVDRYLAMQNAEGLPTEWDWDVTRQDALIIWNNNPRGFSACVRETMRTREWSKQPKVAYRHYVAICKEIMETYMPRTLYEEANDASDS